MIQASTSLGSKELHKRHSVMIEGGKYPRSRVLDQFIFDRYLMEGLITLTHHRAAEVMLGMAAKAGMWAKGAALDGTYVDAPKTSKDFFAMAPLGNALRRIRVDCGENHFIITRKVIIDNRDVRKMKAGIAMFMTSMDYVNNHIIFFHRNPLRHLK